MRHLQGNLAESSSPAAAAAAYAADMPKAIDELERWLTQARKMRLAFAAMEGQLQELEREARHASERARVQKQEITRLRGLLSTVLSVAVAAQQGGHGDAALRQIETLARNTISHGDQSTAGRG